MKRQERKIYCRCIAVMAVYIIAGTYFYTLPADASDLSEKAVFTDVTLAVEKMSTEQAIVAKTGQIRENTPMSDMPCENPEAFERWLETYEQETSEEEAEKPNINTDCCEDVQTGIPTELPTGVETTVEVPSERVEETVAVYSVNGETLNPDLQEYLYNRLSDYQLEWFMPYAIMIAYQESKFNIYAENPNGLDKGLFQFRLPYYTGTDIFNPYEQIDIFVQQMANRSQYDVYEMISRHNVSDWGSYNEVYVGQVLAHEQNLRKVN